MTSSNFSVATLELELKQLYFLWRAAALGAPLPQLKLIGLPALPTPPSILSIYEILRSTAGEPIDFKGLYVRSKLNKTLSKAFTGTWLSDHIGKGPGSKMWGAFVQAATHPFPLQITLPYIGPLKNYRSTSELYLPVYGERDTVEYVMVGVVLRQAAFGQVIAFPSQAKPVARY